MNSKTWLVAGFALFCGAAWARDAAEPPKDPETSDLNARRQMDSAKELLAAREHERALKLLESILDRYPNDPIRFQVHLVLGKYYLEQKKPAEAIGHLTRLQVLEKPNELLTGETRELFLEALLLAGQACFEQRQYERVFPLLRRITANYPNTAWTNRAYYYIGMSHFALNNWNKAIEALGLVGTFVDAASPALSYAEAGRRLYVKVSDADLPVLHRLGREIVVTARTTHGDQEKMVCIPLSGKGDLFIGSLQTEVGPANPGDGVLQVVSGATITCAYLDDNTQTGEKDVPRSSEVKVVSTASLVFTTGTYENLASSAFLGQPVFLTVFDADLDTTPAADALSVKICSRYREEEPKDSAAEEPAKKEEKWKVRDEVTLSLAELGEGEVIRTGRFGGSIKVVPVSEGRADRSGGALACQVNDEVLAVYVDALHGAGATPREVKARITVSGEIENRPRAEQYVVTDPLLRAKKNTVEASAFLELARIFKGLGLDDGARSKADEGLALVEIVVRAPGQLPSSLREKAFQLKWDLELSKDDFAAALSTCQLFAKLFPNSPLVDAALLGMGRARLEAKQYKEAIEVFHRILTLPQSQAKAEAQFRIAQATEALAESAPSAGGSHPANAAIQQYKLVADRHPGSEFAGEALAKVVDYHIRSKDYAQADDLLEQVFHDHPDARFLDKMLIKWAVVSSQRGDNLKAQQKLNQLVTEYPESKFAEEARKMLLLVEAKLRKAAGDKTPEAP